MKEVTIEARTVQLTGFYGNPYYAAEIGLRTAADNTSAPAAGTIGLFFSNHSSIIIIIDHSKFSSNTSDKSD